MDGRAASWRKTLSQSITTPDALPASIEIDRRLIQEVISRYPMGVNPYYLGLIKEKDDQIMNSDKASSITKASTNQSENSIYITKSRIGKSTWVFTVILPFLENNEVSPL